MPWLTRPIRRTSERSRWKKRRKKMRKTSLTRSTSSQNGSPLGRPAAVSPSFATSLSRRKSRARSLQALVARPRFWAREEERRRRQGPLLFPLAGHRLCSTTDVHAQPPLSCVPLYPLPPFEYRSLYSDTLPPTQTLLSFVQSNKSRRPQPVKARTPLATRSATSTFFLASLSPRPFLPRRPNLDDLQP